jgi:UDP-2,3-diacylglucosamine hydrolase
MAVAVVADAHLGGPGGSAGPLVRQLDALDRQCCERLVLLGDLFQVWVGNDRFETPEIVAVMNSLRRVRAKGIPLHYIEGNRDFFLAGSSYGEFFDSVGSELEFETGGRSYLAVHGDGINAKDYLYRFWHRISKNRLSRWAMYHLPHSLAKRLISGFEQELSKTNFKHKRRLPEDVIVEFAKSRLGSRCDILLLGHFHEPFRCSMDQGEVIVFDAWFKSRRVEWVGGSFDEQENHGSA